MIQETMTHVCRVCRSTHIVKNGTNRGGNAQDHCKDCGTYRVLMPKQAYSETAFKALGSQFVFSRRKKRDLLEPVKKLRD